MDLFSGDSTRIQTAVQNLWDDWVNNEGSTNNLRIFVNGKLIKPVDVSRRYFPQIYLTDGTCVAKLHDSIEARTERRR